MRLLLAAFAFAVIVAVCALRCAYLLIKLLVLFVMLVWNLLVIADLSLRKEAHAG
jgi:hypothetical protein